MMLHSFMRLMLCWMHLAYRKPAVNADFYYANSGPFAERIKVLTVINDWVQYEILYKNDVRSDHWTTVDTFALMCRQHPA